MRRSDARPTLTSSQTPLTSPKVRTQRTLKGSVAYIRFIRSAAKLHVLSVGLPMPSSLVDAYVTAVLTVEAETLAIYHHGEPGLAVPCPLTPSRCAGGEECDAPQRCSDGHSRYVAVNDLPSDINYPRSGMRPSSGWGILVRSMM